MTTTDKTQQQWKPQLIEAVASLTTLAAIAAIFLNYIGSHLTFFGEPVDIDPEEVRFYWIAVAVLAAGLVASFGAATWRRARKSYVWHSLMAAVGLVVAGGFAVTQTGPPVSPEPEPREPARYGSACHSGGDSDDCVGG